MATTTTSNNRPKANDLDGTVREHAEASINDVQDLAAATVDHTREVTTALSRSALSVTRSSEVGAKGVERRHVAAVRQGGCPRGPQRGLRHGRERPRRPAPAGPAPCRRRDSRRSLTVASRRWAPLVSDPGRQ